MITFYPRDIGMWREHFNFNPSITATLHEKTDHKCFPNREEFIQFLKEHGVRLDDPQHPLKIESADTGVYSKGHDDQGELLIIVQWSVLGWIRDNYCG
jgi:hypothetical protein